MNNKNGMITPTIEDGLLASRKNAVPKTIPISADARNADGGTLLPIGMVLTLVTNDSDDNFGLYMEYDAAATSPDTEASGQGDESNAMVLAHRVDVGNIGELDKIPASAYLTAQLKREKVIVAEGFDWSKVQRLVLWPRQAQ